MTIRVTIPIRIESLNQSLRKHWAARSRIKARSDTWFALRAAGKFDPAILPCVVTITRIAPRKLDEGDNLPGGTAKQIRDGIADWLGVNDNDPRVVWAYAQRKGKPHEYAAAVTIEAAA